MSEEKFIPEKSKILPNSFQTPNILVDEFMRYLSGNEVKAYLVIDRKTLGWQKQRDNISLSQIVELTGMGRGTAIDTMRTLCGYGLIVKISENDPKRNHGSEYSLQTDDRFIDTQGLIDRDDGYREKDALKMENARAKIKKNIKKTPSYPIVPPTIQQDDPHTIGQYDPHTIQYDTQKPLATATIKNHNTVISKEKVKLPDNSSVDWMIAGGVSSEKIDLLSKKENAEREKASFFEQKMGYNPLPWWTDKGLKALLKFLMDKTPDEIETFARWSKAKYSSLSPAKARQRPDLVEQLWMQAFAPAPTETKPRPRPVSAEA